MFSGGGVGGFACWKRLAEHDSEFDPKYTPITLKMVYLRPCLQSGD